MGEVYLAHEESLDRQVAIKTILRGKLLDPEIAQRFSSEGRTLAKLNHPNIVTVFNVGEHEGLPYLVMEYVTGVPLGEFIQKNVVGILDAVSIFRQIAEGMRVAHRNHVIHRDLKPANVVIAADRTAKIIDFGIAKSFDAESSAEMTQGFVVGTPKYLAPELLSGGYPSERSDIYCMGIILYEMLTGFSPFEGKTVFEVLEKIKDHQITYPESLDQLLPEALKRFIEKLMHKDESERYQDIDTILKDLDAIDLSALPKDFYQTIGSGQNIQQLGSVVESLVQRGFNRVEISLILGFAAELSKYEATQLDLSAPGQDTTVAPSSYGLRISTEILEKAIAEYEKQKRAVGKRSRQPKSVAPDPRASQILRVLLFGWMICCAGIFIAGERFNWSFFKRINGAFTDLKFHARGTVQPKNKIVIADVDTESLRQLGRWPWSRQKQAHLLEKILQEGPKAVALDILYSEPEETQDGDQKLKSVIARYRDQVVLAWEIDALCDVEQMNCVEEESRMLKQMPLGFERYAVRAQGLTSLERGGVIPRAVGLSVSASTIGEAAASQGFVNVQPDVDGIFRHIHLLAMAGGFPHPSLALALAMKSNVAPPVVSFDEVGAVQSFRNSAAQTLSVNREGVAELNYRGPSYTFPHISAQDILREDDIISDELNHKLTGNSKHELLHDAYVFLGVTAIGLGDLHPVPIDPVFPGVEFQATALDNILSSDFLHLERSAAAFFGLLVLMTGWIGFLFLSFGRLKTLAVLALGASVSGLIFCVDVYGLFARGWNLPSGLLYLQMIGSLILALVHRAMGQDRIGNLNARAPQRAK